MIDLETLVAKEAIRELVLQYCRGVDRQNVALLRELYAPGATDTHGDTFDGSAADYIDFLERSFPYMKYSGHHVCNHLVSVSGDHAEGEVYAIAIHVIPDGKGGLVEDVIHVRYVDRYGREAGGVWRFTKRVVTYDYRTRREIAEETLAGLPDVTSEPSYNMLTHAVFQRGK